MQHVAYGVAQLGVLALPFAFLAGLLRSRLAQTAVSRLVLELGQTPPPGKLQEALALSLGDPSVQLAYWWPDRQAFVDPEGKLVELSDLPPGLTPTILERGGERVGALVHDRHLDEEPELIEAVGAWSSEPTVSATSSRTGSPISLRSPTWSAVWARADRPSTRQSWPSW